MIASTPIDFGWLHEDAALAPAGGARTVLLVAMMVVGTAVLAALVVARLRRDRAGPGPTIRHLAGHLGLSAAERRLLTRVARLSGRPHAGSLLISRGCFDAAVRVYASRYRPPPRLAAIRRTIFE